MPQVRKTVIDLQKQINYSQSLKYEQSAAQQEEELEEPVQVVQTEMSDDYS